MYIDNFMEFVILISGPAQPTEIIYHGKWQYKSIN